MGKRKEKKKQSDGAAALSFNPFQALAKNETLKEGAKASVSKPSEAADVSDASAEATGASDNKDGSPWTFGAKVVVTREKKGRAGKTVTRITGVDGDLEALKKQVKKALGCGATIEEGEIVLLGSLTERAATYLESIGAKRVVKGN